jgi:hypothetical protein
MPIGSGAFSSAKTLTLTGLGLAAAAAITLAPGAAHAQQPPPPGDNPTYYAPPGAYAPAPPPGYYPAQPQYAPAGPRVINDWEEGQPIPPGYHPTTKIRTGLVIGGAVLFGVTYITTALIGAAISDVCDSSCRNAKLLLIPVAGPFTLMGSTTTATGNFLLALDGLAQAGGVAMFIAGLAAQKTVLVRNVAGVQVTPMPMNFGRNSAGVGFVGTF